MKDVMNGSLTWQRFLPGGTQSQFSPCVIVVLSLLQVAAAPQVELLLRFQAFQLDLKIKKSKWFTLL